jgi:trigger factor
MRQERALLATGVRNTHRVQGTLVQTDRASMDVQIENSTGLVRQMRVRIPADRVSAALDEKLKAIAGRVRIPGFRPGKAPLTVVQQQYGETVRMDVIQDLVRGSYPEAVDKAGVHPASMPQFQVMAEKPGEPLEYVASFEVYPVIKLKGLDQLKIEQPAVQVGDADIDKVIESLRKSARKLPAVARAARQGDVAVVNFEGHVDGKPFQGGKGEKVSIEIGLKQFIPGFEEGLVGHSAGDKFDLEVEFPADYRREDLRAKKALFKAEVVEVQEPAMPELDAEFLKSHNVEESAGVAGLRAKIQAALEGERDKAVKNRLKQQALDQLLTANPIDLPQSLVAQETERLRDETASRFNAGKLKPDQKQKLLPDDLLAPNARRRVALGLLVGEVIKQKSITVDAQRIDKMLDELAADYQQPEQVKQYYRSKPELLSSLRAVVLEEQAVEALIAGVKPSEKKMTLDELLNPKTEEKAKT